MKQTLVNREIKGWQVRAIFEVMVVAATYIAISTSAVGMLNADYLFPAEWSSAERTTGSGFLAADIAYLAF